MENAEEIFVSNRLSKSANRDIAWLFFFCCFALDRDSFDEEKKFSRSSTHNTSIFLLGERE